MKITWRDGEREPQCEPNPAYPNGVDIDISRGAARTCLVQLPYPAKRCGLYVIECDLCMLRTLVTTAGRRDDPRSVKLACRHAPGRGPDEEDAPGNEEGA